MLTVTEALTCLLENVEPVHETEFVAIPRGNGRVLTSDQYSHLNVPNMNNSAMDGYAIRFEDINGADTVLTINQRVPAGSRAKPLQKGEAAQIFTGAPIPEGANTVIRQEWCKVLGNQLTLLRLPEKGESIRYAGEDIKKGELVLKKGTRLQVQHLGIAASIGLIDLPVARRLKVALMSTGNELVLQGELLTPGKIYNSNFFVLRGLLENLGCVVTDFGVIADNLKETRSTLADAAQAHDFILTSGGVSVGEEDHIKPAIEAEGKLHFWQVAVKPGKPLVYGEINDDSGLSNTAVTPIIGLPGNPVSSFVTFLLFVRPYLLRRLGVADVEPKLIKVRADFSKEKTEERNEFLRARLNENGGLDLFKNQGSGVLSSIVWGDGLIDNPPQQEIKEGDLVDFIPFSELVN